MQRGRSSRKDKIIQEERHGLFRKRQKYPEPTKCEECGALYEKGRWTWSKAGEKAQHAICPACRRIQGNRPAGYVEISGDFYRDHREELMNLIGNIAEQQRAEHPLERLMAIEDLGDYALVTTTGVHIARRIGEALAHSYQGEFSFRYAEGEKKIRVYWRR